MKLFKQVVEVVHRHLQPLEAQRHGLARLLRVPLQPRGLQLAEKLEPLLRDMTMCE